MTHNTHENHPAFPDKYNDPMVLEVYRQAHELRRKWESHIWQWSVVVTGLAAFYAYVRKVKPLEDSWNSVILLALLTLFFLAAAFNVLRSRFLMKSIEQSIIDFHNKMHSFAKDFPFPMIPRELDRRAMKPHGGDPVWKACLNWINLRSSTMFAVIFHFAAFVTFLFMTVRELLAMRHVFHS